MTYVILDKVCSNACILHYVGSSFEDATNIAGRICKNARRATYVLTTEQMQNIFFSTQSKEDINNYWKEHSTNGTYGPRIYLTLPADFKKHLK